MKSSSPSCWALCSVRYGCGCFSPSCGRSLTKIRSGREARRLHPAPNGALRHNPIPVCLVATSKVESTPFAFKYSRVDAAMTYHYAALIECSTCGRTYPSDLDSSISVCSRIDCPPIPLGYQDPRREDAGEAARAADEIRAEDGTILRALAASHQSERKLICRVGRYRAHVDTLENRQWKARDYLDNILQGRCADPASMMRMVELARSALDSNTDTKGEA